MADDKNKVTDKAGEIAKNIWLAGVGAYGKAVDEAQGRLEKAGVESPKLFRELVKAGAALEEEARDAIEAGNAARSSVEERINRARENFNLQRPARGEDLLALHEKIDRLNNKVDSLTDALTASGVLKAHAKHQHVKRKQRQPLKPGRALRPRQVRKPQPKKHLHAARAPLAALAEFCRTGENPRPHSRHQSASLQRRRRGAYHND